MNKYLWIIILFIAVIAVGAYKTQAQDIAVPASQQQIQLSFSPIVKQVSPAVVNIYTKRVVTRNYSPFGNDPFFDQFFGGGFGSRGLSRQQVESSLGSGVIINADGVIVTNAHVVKGAQEISVVLSDGREFDARISTSDKQSDLAILRVDTEGKKLPFAQLKPSESLEVGDLVLAIGNPFGVGQTVTSGIISALARSSLNINDFNFFIQTDAAINPGNSGGPLVAMDGTVIGINTAIYSRSGGSLGIGFAVPSEMVAAVIAADKNGDTGQNGIVRPWLGFDGQALTRDLADSMGINIVRGVVVTKLNPHSPVLKAGLKVGDVVLKVNGRAVKDPAELSFRLATVPLGQQADLTILHKGKERIIKITAMAPPDKPARETKTLEGRHPLNGATLSNINPRVAVELGVDTERSGVVVVNSSRGLVSAGDIILSINDEDIDNMADLERTLSQAARQGYFAFVIERNGQRRQVVIR